MNLESIFASSVPHAAVAIGPERVTAIDVSGAPDRPVITAHGSEPLPAGAVVPSLTGQNITDNAAVAAAVRRVFERLGSRPRRVALSLPDTVGKVSLLRFDKLPQRADDLDQLIKWQVRKAVPFPVEEAQVSYSRGVALEGGGREYVVVLARRDVVREYESVCEVAGAHAGLVDLATLNAVNGLLASQGAVNGDCLVVHVTSHYATLAILRAGQLIFYRNRGDEAEGDLAGLVHQTAMYYEDRLGGQGFSKVLLIGSTAAYAGMQSGEWLRRNLEERLRTEVVPITPDAVRFADRIKVDAGLADAYSPLVGLLRRKAR